MNENSSTFDASRQSRSRFSLKSSTAYFGVMVLLIVVSFFNGTSHLLQVGQRYAFWWMPTQWFTENAFSPGPMAILFFGAIIYFKLKHLDSAFRITTEDFVRYGIPLGVLIAIFYFGTEHPGAIPLSDKLVAISFFALFIVLTAVLFYTAAYVSRTGTSDTDRQRRMSRLFSWILIVFSLTLHFLAMRGDLPRLSIMAYLGLMLGLIMNIFGWKVTLHMLFPVLFLLFMVPWSFIDDYIGGPLRVFVTTISVGIMNMFGMGVERVGTTMSVGNMTFAVEAACSGLKSLMALSALGATFAFITQPTLFRKYFVAICAIPIALCTNILRLIGVAVMAKLFNQDIAMTVFHDNASIFLYIAATILLFSVDKLFKVQWLKIEDW